MSGPIGDRLLVRRPARLDAEGAGSAQSTAATTATSSLSSGMAANLDASLDASAPGGALDAELSSSLAARHGGFRIIQVAIAAAVAAILIALGPVIRRLRRS